MNNRKLIIEEISRMRSMMGLNENYVPTLLLESKDPKALIDALVTFAKGADAAKGNLVRGMDAETKEFFNSRLTEYGDELFGAGSAIKSIDDLVDATKAAELAAFSKKLASEFDNVKALIKSQGFDFSKYVYLPKFVQPTVTDKNIKNLIKQLPDTALLKNVLEKAKNKDFANILDDDIIALNQHLAALRQANAGNGNMRKYLDGIISDFKNLTKDKSDWNVLENAKLGDNLDNNNVFVQNFKNKAGNDIEAKVYGDDATGDSIIVTNKSVDPPTETIFYRTLQEPLDQESVLYRFDEEGNIVLFKQGEEFKPDGWKDDNGVIVFTKDNVDYVTDKDSTYVVDGKVGADSWFTKTEIKKTESETVTSDVADEVERESEYTPTEKTKYEEYNEQSDDEINIQVKKLKDFRNRNKFKNIAGDGIIVLDVAKNRNLITEDEYLKILTKYDKASWMDVFRFGTEVADIRKGLVTKQVTVTDKLTGDSTKVNVLKGDEVTQAYNKASAIYLDETGRYTAAQKKAVEGEYFKNKGLLEDNYADYLKGVSILTKTPITSEYADFAFKTFGSRKLSVVINFINAGFGRYGGGVKSGKWWLRMVGIYLGLGLFGLAIKGLVFVGDTADYVSQQLNLDEFTIKRDLVRWSTSKSPMIKIGSSDITIGSEASWYGTGISESQFKLIDSSLGIFVTQTPLYGNFYIYKYMPDPNKLNPFNKSYVIVVPKDSASLSIQMKIAANEYVKQAKGIELYTPQELNLPNTTTTKGSLGEGTALNDNIKTAMKNTFGADFPDVLKVTDGKFGNKTGDIETYSFTVVKPNGDTVQKTLQFDTKTKLFKK